ncbi:MULTISPECIES: hypothetical protein [Rhodobacterales]|jgi:hypothetical protein|uniref:Uncharacterized protein n=3 Tax=Alphaproteobacteria TaxID=28211 RepID=A0ABD4XB28_9RHOB|nr:MULTISPECIES: hypothetical protein [Phaeobacter]MEE2633346.1 hypothetical protein [Pseudomonadota bacterium]MDE4097544.1 hypothetical protein [Phaeobacter gallaeciensis]MDE4106618.1 hypothetical protein [Phaeobacter gallaeciensis]MDE4110808.1 hypothetical protein [Phaeobacter gallaeciensis]MDE4115543.1 hypothetical protein [Phaeobacter gallaeciensis]
MFMKTATDWVSATLSVGFIVAITAIPMTAAAEAEQQSVENVYAFNWMANGKKVSKREARARQAARRASWMSTRGGATWICSPAGFGQKSRCYRG